MPLKSKKTGGPLRRREVRTVDLIADNLDAHRELEKANQSARNTLLDKIVSRCWAEFRAAGIIEDDPRKAAKIAKKQFEHPAREFYCAEIIEAAHRIGQISDADPELAIDQAIMIGVHVVQMGLDSADRQAAGQETWAASGAATRSKRKQHNARVAREAARDSKPLSAKSLAEVIHKKTDLTWQGRRPSARWIRGVISDLSPKKPGRFR
jgi:hypothetical protein